MTDSDFTIGFKQGQEHGIQIMQEKIEDIKQEIGILCNNIDCWNCLFRDKTVADKTVLTFCKLGQIFDKHLQKGE